MTVYFHSSNLSLVNISQQKLSNKSVSIGLRVCTYIDWEKVIIEILCLRSLAVFKKGSPLYLLVCVRGSAGEEGAGCVYIPNQCLFWLWPMHWSVPFHQVLLFGTRLIWKGYILSCSSAGHRKPMQKSITN